MIFMYIFVYEFQNLRIPLIIHQSKLPPDPKQECQNTKAFPSLLR
jgi:hypothetical protein